MTDEVALTIDGLGISATGGTNLMDAAAAAGIYIPHLCYHPDLEPAGVCRLCMVEIQGRGMTLACRTPVEQGLVVRTESPEIDKVRRTAVELLIVNHHGECLACDRNNQCELQRIAAYVGVDQERLAAPPPLHADRCPSTPPIRSSRAIPISACFAASACGPATRSRESARSTSPSGDITPRLAPSRTGRSSSPMRVVRRVRGPVPGGALPPKGFQQPSREVKTVCPYCGVGCGMYLGVRGNRIVAARGDLASPVNRGSLCVKGRFGHEFVHHPDRLTERPASRPAASWSPPRGTRPSRWSRRSSRSSAASRLP